MQYKSLLLPAIVLGGLYYGAYHAGNPARKLAQLAQFLTVARVLEVNQETAQLYGQTKQSLAQAGTPIPENDIWIASLALQLRLPLLTNDAHFSLVRGLTVVQW